MVTDEEGEKMTVKMEVGCLGVQPLPADDTWWVGACRDCGGLEHSTQQGYGWFVKTEWGWKKWIDREQAFVSNKEGDGMVEMVEQELDWKKREEECHPAD